MLFRSPGLDIEVQFTKTPAVLRSLDVEPGKTERAREELRAKGIDPDG